MLLLILCNNINAEVQVSVNNSFTGSSSGNGNWNGNVNDIYYFPNTIGDFSCPFYKVTGTLQTVNPIGACYPINPIYDDNVICLVQRDEVCSFTEKTINAEIGGCSGVIIYDNVNEDLMVMTGSHQYISIPAVFISLESFNTINQIMLSYDDNSLFVSIDDTSYGKYYMFIIGFCIALSVIFCVGCLVCCRTCEYNGRNRRFQRRSIPFIGNKASYGTGTNPISSSNVVYEVSADTDSLLDYNDYEGAGVKGKGNRTTCSICIMSYKKGEINRELMCGHTFHQKCVDPWLSVNSTCPVCRTSV